MKEVLFSKLKEYKQEHLLKYWDSLNEEEKEQLSAQLEEIDWEELSELIEEYVLVQPEMTIPSKLEPSPYFPKTPASEEQKALYDSAVKKGKELLSEGKVAALTVAGGQGTRLGFNGPKGTFPITPLKNKTLFQYFADSIMRTKEKYNCKLPWFVMTSIMNNDATVDFFKENDFFGHDPESIIFFTQGTMPAIGLDGKLLLSEKDSLSLAPNGHGGTLLALKKSGSLDKMKAEGVEYISYFQVDNPLVSVADPLFIGLHYLEQAEMSARMLAKTGPFEKLGNFCVADDRLLIIEYSDMPEELAKQTNPDGSLRFISGSPAIHVISCDFVERLTADGRLKLPWHRADKKVAYIDDNGKQVKPETENAVKLETFIFDALELAGKTMVLEAAREDEFAPTKNPTGVDSVESCREMLIDRDARRLKLAGVAVPENSNGTPACKIEISPRLIVDDEDIIDYYKDKEPPALKEGDDFCLG